MTAETHPMVAHPFLSGLSPRQLEPLADHASWRVFAQGQRIFAEGGEADRFWLIEDGEIALDIQVPGRGLVTIETLGPWTVLGWSWLVPPFREHLDARQLSLDSPADVALQCPLLVVHARQIRAPHKKWAPRAHFAKQVKCGAERIALHRGVRPRRSGAL